MSGTRLPNGNAIHEHHDSLSLVLPDRAGRFTINRHGYSGSGVFQDTALFNWAVSRCDAYRHTPRRNAVTYREILWTLAELSLAEMGARAGRPLDALPGTRTPQQPSPCARCARLEQFLRDYLWSTFGECRPQDEAVCLAPAQLRAKARDLLGIEALPTGADGCIQYPEAPPLKPPSTGVRR